MTAPRALPPHSIEAEESVVGGVLVHAARLATVIPLVKPDDFYHPALRAIYEAMLELDADSTPVDALTVVEKMRALGTFEKLSAFEGDAYLYELMAKVVTVENIAHHAKLVHAKATRRRWALKYQELAAAGYNDGDDDEYFARAEQEMLDLTTARQAASGGPRRLWDMMRDYQNLLGERVQRRQETGSGVTGIPTGYAQIDALLSGMHPGDLTIIAARPAMGKTAFVMNMVINAARMVDAKKRYKHPALVFSLEMSDEQLSERVVSGEARIDSQRLRQGDINATHWTSITGATSRLAPLPVQVETAGVITVAEIRSMARVWKMGLAANPAIAEDARPIVVVDYLQLITASGKKRNASRTEDVSEMSRGLKQLAKDLKCPVVALSQLNRSLESRTNKRPMLSDLRESGAIEQDADVIAFIYRDEKYHDVEPGQCPECNHGVAEFIVGKQRMGPCGTIHLAFIDHITRFEPLSHRGAQ